MSKEKSKYIDCEAICACGTKFTTKSTKDTMHVEVCSECHPFYTGQQKSSNKKGKVEQFNKKYGIDQ